MAGYIGSKVAVVSSGAERKKVFTATSGQTSFTGLSYTVNNVHVFQNGVRLVDGTDYTASDGNSLTLTVGASTDDQVVVVSYNTFQTSDTVSASTGGTFAGDVNFTGAFTSQGIDDNATSTAMTLDASGNLLVGTTSTATNDVGFKVFQSTGQTVTTASGTNPVLFNRKTSDGDIAIFRKDDVTVGSIGTGSSRLAIGTSNVGAFFATGNIGPWNTTTNTSRGDAIDLGSSSGRWKDLYLSGGVYLGGTGAANKLDDYEEGTFTPTFSFNGGSVGIVYDSANGFAYTKVGNVVTIQGIIYTTNKGSSTGSLSLNGLPFTFRSGNSGYNGTSAYYEGISVPSGYNSITLRSSPNSNSLSFMLQKDDGNYITVNNTHCANQFQLRLAYTYITT